MTHGVSVTPLTLSRIVMRDTRSACHGSGTRGEPDSWPGTAKGLVALTSTDRHTDGPAAFDGRHPATS